MRASITRGFSAVLLALVTNQGATRQRDSAGWMVPQLHSAGVLLGTRIGASIIWPDAFDPRRVERNGGQFADSWRLPPQWRDGFFESDQDPWTINVIGHGLLGSEFYLRHRQAWHSPWVALAMTAAWTLTWEYLVEAWHKRPSGIDLIWTPLGGGLLGEGRYYFYQRISRMRGSALRHLLLYLIDPLGQLERDLFGLPY